MKLTNKQIYSYTRNLLSLNIGDIKMPVKVGFFLQKNIQKLAAAGQEIEEARDKVARDFGKLNEEGNMFIVPPELIGAAQKELDDLFNIEQDIDIHIFKISDFDGIELTYQELSAITFMIEE